MAYISFQPSDYFSTLLYSYASSPNAITGAGFAPDAVSLKSISGTSGGNNWYIANTVMGNTKTLRWNDTIAEATTTDSILSFDSDGYTLGADATANCNATGTNYVGYNWKAGTTTGIAGSPSITPSSYSFNATSGFSIIKYTGNSTSGATLPHGLGVAPKMIIVKNLTTTESWMVYHESLGATKYLILNTTAAEATNTGRWNDTAPTSTLFSLGDSASTNENPYDYIAYCFADVKGYSKMGGYTGNGNADGTFIYTGFRPAFVLNKRSDSTANWVIHDSKRPASNVCNLFLKANASSAEDTDSGRYVDLLSNGFKWRGTDTEVNYSGSTYIYAAFAEFPIVSSNDVPTVAR